MSLKIVLDTKDAARNADNFAKAIDRVATATGKAGESADKLMKATATLSRRFGRIATKAGEAATQMNAAAGGMNTASASAAKFGNAATRAGSSAGSLAGTIKNLAVQYVGLRAAIGSVRTLADLEQGFVTLGTVTGATGEKLNELKRIAIETAQATKFTPKETSEALLELSRAGQDAATASASLLDVSNLAAAGVLDLGASAGLTAASMAQFARQGVDAKEVASTFVAVADRTKSTVSSLGSAMSQAGQAAADFDISLENAVITVGVLQTAGIQASRSGRALKTILSSLATAGSKKRGRSALAELSLDASDLIAKEGDLFGLFKQLRSAINNLDDPSRKTGILVDLVGKDFSGILSAAIEGTDEMVALTEKIENKQDELSQKAIKQNDTLSGSLKDVASAYQEILAAGEEAGAASLLKDFFKSVAGGLRILAGLDGALGRSTAGARTAATAFKAVGIAIASIAVGKLVASIGSLILSMGSAVLKAQTLGAALKALATLNPWALLAVGAASVISFMVGYNSETDIAIAKAKELKRAQQDLAKIDTARLGLENAGRESKSAQLLTEQTQDSATIARNKLAEIEVERAKNTDIRERNPLQFKSPIGTETISRIADKQALAITADLFKSFEYQLSEETKGLLESLRKANKDIGESYAEFAENNPVERIANLNLAAERESERRAKRRSLISDRSQLIASIIQSARGDVKANLESGLTEINRPKVAVQGAAADAARKVGDQLDSEARSIGLEDLKSKEKIRNIRIEINELLKEGLGIDSDKVSKAQDQIEAEQLLINARKQAANEGKTLKEFNSQQNELDLKAKAEEVDFAEKLNTIRQKEKVDRDNATQQDRERKNILKVIGDELKEGEKALEKKTKMQGELNEFIAEEARLRGLAKIDPEQAEIAEKMFQVAKKLTELGADPDLIRDQVNKARDGAMDLNQAARREENQAAIAQKAQEELQSQKQNLQQIGGMVGNSFAQAFDNIASGTMKARDAFKAMAKDMISQLIRIATVKAITNFALSFAGGAGGTEVRDAAGQGLGALPAGETYGPPAPMQQGGIIPAQQGRVISSPTMISRGGKNYSVSEGGGSTPEAVFPLQRNARGELGITGVGGGGSVNHFHFPGIKNGEDARKAKRTIGQQVSGVMAASEQKRNKSGMRPKG